jgi:mono/diheme cytochrome c family protein
VVTALLGWCLARSSGYQGRLVTQHMWGGVAIAAASWGCWMLRSRVIGERLGGAYVAALIGTVALVFWAGYRGGQIAEGENHMTEKLPQAVRGMFVPRNQSAGATTPDAESVYGAQVAPVLAANCTSCHGAEKHKGNLRLDSYEAILRGGRDGPVVRAGDVKDSEIVRRITMLPGEDGAMPPEGKPRLSAAEIELIKAWIAGGASKSAAMPGTAVGRTK